MEDDGPQRDLVRRGDRFRLTRDAEVQVTYIYYAPSHTVGGPAVLPEGTVIVAFDQRDGKPAFPAYPEAYDEFEEIAVPPKNRADPRYAGGYGLFFRITEIGDLLEPIEPLQPRPKNNLLPRLRRPDAPKRQGE